jgi:hypothetical protein
MAKDPEEKRAEEKRAEELLACMERGGPREVVRFIEAIPDPEARRTTYALAQKRFGTRDWPGKDLDALIEIVTAGISESLRQAGDAASSEAAWKLTDFANILSYNLSADLAECWPEDATARERHHVEAGLRAAEDCVRWRRELGKPPDRRAMAYWAVGMHQLSLGNLHEALGAFDTASGLARVAVVGTGRDEVKPGGEFGVILYAGYAGIARWRLGDERGRAEYEQSCQAFQGSAARFPEQKEDAEFGLSQLRWVARRFSPEADTAAAS